jgi:hypothetical protein
VEISDGAIIKCIHDSWIKGVNKSSNQSEIPSTVILQDIEGSGRGLISGTIQRFTSRDINQNINVPDGIRTTYLTNTSQKKALPLEPGCPVTDGQTYDAGICLLMLSSDFSCCAYKHRQPVSRFLLSREIPSSDSSV